MRVKTQLHFAKNIKVGVVLYANEQKVSFTAFSTFIPDMLFPFKSALMCIKHAMPSCIFQIKCAILADACENIHGRIFPIATRTKKC